MSFFIQPPPTLELEPDWMFGLQRFFFFFCVCVPLNMCYHLWSLVCCQLCTAGIQRLEANHHKRSYLKNKKINAMLFFNIDCKMRYYRNLLGIDRGWLLYGPLIFHSNFIRSKLSKIVSCLRNSCLPLCCASGTIVYLCVVRQVSLAGFVSVPFGSHHLPLDWLACIEARWITSCEIIRN